MENPRYNSFIKKYYFNSAEDMRDLAREIQTLVYWGYKLCTPGEEEFSAKDIWDYIDYFISLGAEALSITEYKEIVLYYKGGDNGKSNQ